MATWNAVPVALVLTLVGAVVPAVPGVRAQEAPVRSGGIYDQITISLPNGWSVYDQVQALTGKSDPLGVVIFSAEPVTQPGGTTADAAQLAKVDSGEIRSFFVQRLQASKGMRCAKLSRTDIYNIGTRINEDPAIATVGRRLFGGVEPPHTDMDVGSCHGVRFVLEANKDDPAKYWKIDVRAVSDGKVLYLFSLRHRGTYFADNFAFFEQAMRTVEFKQTK